MDIEKVFNEFSNMETCRLNLRELKEEDDRDLLEIFSDSNAMKYYGMKPLETVEDTRSLINKFNDKYRNHSAIRWGISIKEEGLINEYAFFNGQFTDLVMLSLLKKDYV